jgi:hypothetical protein
MCRIEPAGLSPVFRVRVVEFRAAQQAADVPQTGCTSLFFVAKLRYRYERENDHSTQAMND